ncbi:MAG: CAP domain-containing protein, partial [bacterium]
MSFVFHTNAFSQTYKASNLNKLLSTIKNNQKLLIEYQASEIFHTLINDYRKKNGLSELEFNHILWLAARNHNLWMSENKLSHTENVKSLNFTGTKPGDRLDFVSKNSCNWTGENCLYNFSYDEYDTTERNAYSIANESFIQWKNSKGHNENMLGSHGFEGTAFYISKSGVVWATSLFGYCNDVKINAQNNSKSTLKIDTRNKQVKTEAIISKVDIRKIIQKLLSDKLNNKNFKKKKSLIKAAELYTNDFISCNFKNSITLKKRLIYSDKFLLLSNINKYHEYILCKEYTHDDKFNDILKQDLNNWVNDILLSDNLIYGHSIKIINKNK